MPFLFISKSLTLAKKFPEIDVGKKQTPKTTFHDLQERVYILCLLNGSAAFYLCRSAIMFRYG
jgi:hypothetical protein